MSKMVQWTPDKAKRLAKAHNEARENGQKDFVFDGDEYVTDYAYYLIQYLQNNNLISGYFDDSKKMYHFGNPKNN